MVTKGRSIMSYWAKVLLSEWWNRHDSEEAERHGISVAEWRGYRRDQEEMEHRERASSPECDEGICNTVQEDQN